MYGENKTINRKDDVDIEVLEDLEDQDDADSDTEMGKEEKEDDDDDSDSEMEDNRKEEVSISKRTLFRKM